MVQVFALVAGLVFGIGLLVSGLANPAKVLGFLDLAGAWDPSLALVMGGAIGVGVFAFGFAKRLKLSLLGEAMHLPSTRVITRRLLVGSLIFGAGWGLSGICPGPGIVALGAGVPQAALFVLSMLGGMALFAWFEHSRQGAVECNECDDE